MRQLLCVVCASILLVAALSDAQEQRGSITGRVRTPSGSTLPGVTVEARSSSLLGVATAETDAQGVYRLPALPPGRYEITATFPGFKSAKTDNIGLEVSQTLRVDLTLQLIAAEVTALGLQRQATGVPQGPVIVAGVVTDPQTHARPEQVSLLDAARQGNKELATRLLDSGADINAKNSVGWTPLFMAISTGHKEIVEFLLARGADVQAKHHNGESTLDFAVMQGEKEIAEMLLARGVDVNAADNDAVTPLHVAAARGNAKMVALLLASGANVNSKCNAAGGEGEKDLYEGDTPLHVAVLSQREWQALRGVEREEAGRRGEGAHVEAAALLLANGADVNATNKRGKTPLRFAKTDDMKALLRKYGAK